jgi:hypothetical protein
MFFVGMMTFFLISYTFHCTWVTSEAYSSPSIVLSARSHDGSRIIFDDFREAYWWLRMNTPEDAKVCCTGTIAANFKLSNHDNSVVDPDPNPDPDL